MRVGVAAAPRWWGVAADGLPAFLRHVVEAGGDSVEYVVHHGPHTRGPRDPLTVHLQREDWELAVGAAQGVGLHVDLHGSLDPRFRLDRWETAGDDLRTLLLPVIDLVERVGAGQAAPPALVVHAAGGEGGEATTRAAVGWIAEALDRRGCRSAVCVELRAAADAADERSDRVRERLSAFVEGLGQANAGMCWDVANDWLSARRSGRPFALPEESPSRLRHVHLHGRSADGQLHAPLGDAVPWRESLGWLRSVGYAGSVTLEIRYRLASEVGDPWAVLADSIRLARAGSR